MTPDNAIIIFTSLGFAAVALAFVIGMGRDHAEEMIANISGMTPAAKRKARFQKLDDMTKLADQAIEARQSGNKMRPPLQRY